ncbi:MAG TPA: phosphorylase [Xanthobacteraceae bacterium]|jgi:hopanoid-associated phosphorylase
MSSGAKVIAVTSLSLEARIASGSGVSVVCSQASQLIACLEAAVDRALGIISFGVAGGLAPDLRAGDWVIGTAVQAPHKSYPADQRWTRSLIDALPTAVQAEIVGADNAVAHAWEKRQLHARTGAVAVDMESHLAAEVAAAHDIPFAVCRTIIDPAGRDLPPAAVVGLRNDGTPDVLAIFRSVAGRPDQVPALIRIAIDAWSARKALLRGRRWLGPGLGCPYYRESTTEEAGTNADSVNAGTLRSAGS